MGLGRSSTRLHPRPWHPPLPRRLHLVVVSEGYGKGRNGREKWAGKEWAGRDGREGMGREGLPNIRGGREEAMGMGSMQASPWYVDSGCPSAVAMRLPHALLLVGKHQDTSRKHASADSIAQAWVPCCLLLPSCCRSPSLAVLLLLIVPLLQLVSSVTLTVPLLQVASLIIKCYTHCLLLHSWSSCYTYAPRVTLVVLLLQVACTL
jgi:hypothetical protein